MKRGLNMSYTVNLSETNSPQVTIKTSIWSKPQVLVNGQKVKPLKEKGRPYPIVMNDGITKKIQLKFSFIDPVPKVIYDEKEILLDRKLKWYEYALGGIPALLIFAGGAIGAAIGVIASFFNMKIIRSEMSMIIKSILVLINSGVALGIFLVLAVCVQYAFI